MIVQAIILKVDNSLASQDGPVKVSFRVEGSQKGKLSRGERASFNISFMSLSVPRWKYKVPTIEKGQRWLLCLHRAPAGNLYVKYLFYSFRVDDLISLVAREHPGWKGPKHIRRRGIDSYVLQYHDPAAPKAPPVVSVHEGKIAGIMRL